MYTSSCILCLFSILFPGCTEELQVWWFSVPLCVLCSGIWKERTTLPLLVLRWLGYNVLPHYNVVDLIASMWNNVQHRNMSAKCCFFHTKQNKQLKSPVIKTEHVNVGRVEDLNVLGAIINENLSSKGSGYKISNSILNRNNE